MAVKMRYYTTGAGTEEEKIPELQEIAGSAAQQAPTTPAAAEVPTTPTVPTAPTVPNVPTAPAAPVYNSGSGQKQSDLYEQIAARGPFQYDIDKDPLYGIARDRYVNQGRMAMRDTMGQAAALTGGYGSSYGQAVGQQQYDAQLQGLADMIPELYQAAYSRYQDEGDRLQRQYQMLGEQEARDYSRYRDQMGDWQYERAWQQQQDADAYDRASEAYTRLYAIIGATGYQPSAQELEAAGMSQQQAEALRHEYLRQTGQLPVETGGSSGGSSGVYYVPTPTNPNSDPNTSNGAGVSSAQFNGIMRTIRSSSNPATAYYQMANSSVFNQLSEDQKKQIAAELEKSKSGGK